MAVLLLTLAGLALVDSTSIGTLFIPVWLLLAPGGVRAGRLLGYLGAIAAFYFVAGLVLVVGGARLASVLSSGPAPRPVLIAQFVFGAALLVLSFVVEHRKVAATTRVLRWRDRAAAGTSGAGTLTGLALLAALAEVATMLPYLGAIGLLATAEVPGWSVPVVLAGYCFVMVLPALILLAIRVRGPAWIGRVLERLDGWMVAKAGGLLSWGLGIAGFLIARDAGARLWFPHLF